MPLTQSLAILEFLDETYPQPPLLPADAHGRARVRSLAQMLAVDTHPLITPRVRKYLTTTGGFDADAWRAWQMQWFGTGLRAVEQRLASEPGTGRFCHGDAPTMADICLASIFAVMRVFKIDFDAATCPHPAERRRSSVAARCSSARTPLRGRPPVDNGRSAHPAVGAQRSGRWPARPVTGAVHAAPTSTCALPTGARAAHVAAPTPSSVAPVAAGLRNGRAAEPDRFSAAPRCHSGFLPFRCRSMPSLSRSRRSITASRWP